MIKMASTLPPPAYPSPQELQDRALYPPLSALPGAPAASAGKVCARCSPPQRTQSMGLSRVVACAARGRSKLLLRWA